MVRSLLSAGARHSTWGLPSLVLISSLLVAGLGIPVTAQTYTILYSFDGANGLIPGTGLARDSDGNLYGASGYGGNQQACANYGGCGAIYKVDPTGKMTVLYEFSGSPDGQSPNQLTLGPNGLLYGTTQFGGTGNSSSCGSDGCGTVFQFDLNGKETVLHSFAGYPSDGYDPYFYSRLVRDSEGNLYGTTLYGGSSNAFGNPGNGVVFSVSRASKEQVLYSFTGQDDGGLPFSGPIVDGSQHALYGTTTYGGNGPCGNIFGSGCGVVYKVNASGESALYMFQDGSDGASPVASLIQDSAGNLYGTATSGGDLSCTPPANGKMVQPQPGCGVVFKVDPAGTETVLYTFTGTTDGSDPTSPLVMDAAGNLYGTAAFGGDLNCGPPLGCGTVFEINKSGTFTVLHAFSGPDGAFPGNVILDNEGNLYGTAGGGASVPNGKDVIFKLTP
jgi:uncharacterized repeat protein (TIGR03803 family)